MDFHKSLYKSMNATSTNLSPKDRMKRNLKYGQTKRNDLFLQNRIFSLSPKETKENVATPVGKVKSLSKTPRLRKSLAQLNKENPQAGKAEDTLNRQEAYIARFLAWKKKKETEKNRISDKRRPFISACSGNILTSTNVQKPFAPANHKFQAPSNLKIPQESERYAFKIRNLEAVKAKPTPKQLEHKMKNFIAFNKKTVVTPKLFHKSEAFSRMVSVKTKQELNKTPKEVSTVKPNVRRVRSKTEIQVSNKRFNSDLNSKENECKEKAINRNKDQPGKFVKVQKPSTVASLGSKNMVVNEKTRNANLRIEKQPVNIMKCSERKKAASENMRVTKKTVSIKSPLNLQKETNQKPFLVEKTPHKVRAYLKRGAENSNNNKTNAKIESVKVVSKVPKTKNKNQQVKTNMQPPSKLMLFEKPKVVIEQETPHDNPDILNSSFVTSTQKKDSLNPGTIVPALLSNSFLCPIENEKGTAKDENVPLINLSARKSVNIRESEDNEVLATALDNSKSPELNKTPRNAEVCADDDPIVYVSPYVTMSRGKANNKKKEKKLRESLFALDDSSDGIAYGEMRRVKETVRYFRKMLNEEIVRLHARCAEWEQYVKETDQALLEDCGNDMINVAIGQTKLLTSKKFQQFKKLIDQCEQFAKAKYEMKNINDDTEKPILTEDLEGFWQMMYIQVDDIDKRFGKLESWKANNWTDPEEIKEDEKPKRKNKLLTKISKKKTNVVSASEGLKQKLKQMYKAHLETKKKEEQKDLIILTPTTKSRKTIIVEEPTPTTPRRKTRHSQLLSANSDANKILTPSRKSLRIERAIDEAAKILGTPKHKVAEFRLISLLKTPCIACPGEGTCSSRPRKSIMKTPGTAKKRQTVIFNEELYFKSPEKSFGSGKGKKQRRSSSGRKSLSAGSERKERKRSLNLRARRLLVDPNAQIEIPRK